MEWMAAAIALLAAAAAIWQAAEARRANRSAGSHEIAAAAAQERVAAALEWQAQIAERAARPIVPWVFEALGPPNMDQLWSVTNATGEDVTAVDLFTPEGYYEKWIKFQKFPVDVDSGGVVEFMFIRRLGSPPSRMVTVHWTAGDGHTRRRFSHRVA
ncbi:MULTISPECIES: hypothetical protein [unclassified Leifsonia]|uniref:hypothetical protein n=1 Tax=unclassified Leifsonia TaxID=2663824 RepID=UPI000A5B116B|nr:MULTISPECIES: hypothetical protein [unclassified Leifsonia]